MKVSELPLAGLKLIEPEVHGDSRGCFVESWHAERYRAAGVADRFVQDNHSRSKRGVLRGLHYQLPHAQAKLVWVAAGAVFDVAVDIRRGSPSFGRWHGMVLSGETHRQLYVPAGFAHGFLTLSDSAELFYKCSDDYHPEAERGILWSDPDIAIDWPLERSAQPLLSAKDAAWPPLADIPHDRLPRLAPVA